MDNQNNQHNYQGNNQHKRFSPRVEDELEDLYHKLTDLYTKSLRPPKERILVDEDVMKMLRICKRTLATYRKEGLLVPSKVRGTHYYTEADVLDMIERHREMPSSKLRIGKNVNNKKGKS